MKVDLHETITVERSVSECFRYVKDFSTIEQWDPGVYRAEKVTPGAAREGSQFALDLNVAGQKVPMAYHLKVIDPDRRLVLEGKGQHCTALDTIEFRALASGDTEIDYRAALDFPGAPEIAGPVLKAAMRRVGQQAVAGLKRALAIPSSSPKRRLLTDMRDRLVIPAAWDFTERGYWRQPCRSHSQFLDGKRFVVTGPTSGLGLAAACELSRLGAELVLLGRNHTRLASAVDDILDFSGASRESISLVEADLSSLAQVERAIGEISERFSSLDGLINNAGLLPGERIETDEGFELTLAVNLLAPVRLMTGLFPLLARTQGRVVNVASGGLYLAGLRLDDMQSRRGNFDGAQAYARAKRALVSMTETLAEQWKPYGVTCNAMHPGWAATPGVAKSLPAFNRMLSRCLRDARMGADTMVWLVSAQELSQETGLFWFDRQPHSTAVLPGTAVSKRDARALAAWLNDVLSGQTVEMGDIAYG